MDKPKWYFANTEGRPKAEYLAAIMDNIALGAISDESEELFKCVAKLLRAGAKMRDSGDSFGRCGDEKDFMSGAKAWDAALGGEDE